MRKSVPLKHGQQAISIKMHRHIKGKRGQTVDILSATRPDDNEIKQCRASRQRGVRDSRLVIVDCVQYLSSVGEIGGEDLWCFR
jgi:hypothetical protein